MALRSVHPFDYRTYIDKLGGFPQWMVEYAQHNRINGRTGWADHFTNYNYTGGWQDGVRVRRDLHNDLTANIGNDQALLRIANFTVNDFGGIKRLYAINDLIGIRRALVILWNEVSNPPWFAQHRGYLCFSASTPRIASHSKLFEMFDPHKWTIYDSRVATAIICLVRHYWVASGHDVASDYLRFPVPPRNSHGWRRPHSNQFSGVNTHMQGCLAFIYASWLLRRVAEILRANVSYGHPPTTQNPGVWAPLDANWAVYGVEMALWMMGDKQF